MNISLPGPGSAMAFAVSVAIYSSAFSSEISDFFRFILIIMAVIFSVITYQIEKLHKSGTTNKDISTTVQDEKEKIGENKLTQPVNIVFVIFIVMISTGMGILGSISASYVYYDLFNLGFIFVNVILLALIFGLSYLIWPFLRNLPKQKN